MHQVAHTRTINQTRHQVPGITTRGFQTSFLDREHSNIYYIYFSMFGRESSVLCGRSLLDLARHRKDIPCTTHHAYHTRYVDKKYNAD